MLSCTAYSTDSSANDADDDVNNDGDGRVAITEPSIKTDIYREKERQSLIRECISICFTIITDVVTAMDEISPTTSRVTRR